MGVWDRLVEGGGCRVRADDGLIYAMVGSRAELVQHAGLVCNSTLHFSIRARGVVWEGAGQRRPHAFGAGGKKRLPGWHPAPASDSSVLNVVFQGTLPPSAPPTTRNPVRKQPSQTSNVAAGLDNSVLLQIMEQLGLSEAVMNEERERLQPKPPPVPTKTSAKVAELEEKDLKAATHLKNLGT